MSTSGALFENPEDKPQFFALQRHWEAIFQGIASVTGREDEDWVRILHPYPRTGIEGSAVFSARSYMQDKAFRLIEEHREREQPSFVAWVSIEDMQNEVPDLPGSELVIALVTAPATQPLAEELIAKWLDPQTAPETMKLELETRFRE